MIRRQFLASACALMALAAAVSPAAAQTYGSKEEAKALVERAAAHIQAVGKDKAMADFNTPNGPFVDRDLYIFAVGFNGIQTANGANPKLIGVDRNDSVDSNGRLYVQDMIAVAKNSGTGWVEYTRTNPVTKKVEDKVSYIKRIDDYFIGCGAYGKK